MWVSMRSTCRVAWGYDTGSLRNATLASCGEETVGREETADGDKSETEVIIRHGVRQKCCESLLSLRRLCPSRPLNYGALLCGDKTYHDVREFRAPAAPHALSAWVTASSSTTRQTGAPWPGVESTPRCPPIKRARLRTLKSPNSSWGLFGSANDSAQIFAPWMSR